MISTLRTKRLLLLCKIFCIGLLLQFFLNTFVTYELWLTWPVWTWVWLWKEIIIVGITWLLLFMGLRYKKIREMLLTMPIWKFIILLVVTLWCILWISLFVTHVGIGNYIISIRYALIGFFIFAIFFAVAWVWFSDNESSIIPWYNKVIKRVLWLSLGWWAMLRLIPNMLKFFWYNQFGIEWTMGEAPPAVYHTDYNKWYVRNQFLFERPIGFWFFLIAFWPLFFFQVIYRKKKWTILWYGFLYGVLVLSTFSRAALWVWLLQTWILLLLTYRKYLLKWVIFVPWILVLSLLWLFVYKKISVRIYSDVGHIKLLQEGLAIAKDNLIFWWWAWYAGPASHQICYENTNAICTKIHEINTKHQIPTVGYNPENQYLQILIEYGSIWFLWWLILYFYLHIIGLKAYLSATKKDTHHSKKEKMYAYMLFGFSLWILGLSIEWLVLHSFVDRMIVYPFMALFWITYALYRKDQAKEPTLSLEKHKHF